MAELKQHHSSDVDDQAQALPGWEQFYEQLGCGSFRGSVWQMVMANGFLVREQTNRQLREQITPPLDHVVLAVPMAVLPGSVFAGRPLNRDSLMVLGGGREVDVVSAGELDLIGLAVHRSALDTTLAPHSADWLRQAEDERVLDLTPTAAQAIRHMLLAACNESEGHVGEASDAVRESELLSSTLHHAVMLAMSCEGQTPSNAIPRRADTRLRVVKRAIAFMRDNLEQDVGIPEVCAAAFASRRSLQYCFEEFLHTTPQAYLRALRLNEARRSLKQRNDQPITELANTLGFSSASHFTRHYKLMFDELPSETLKLFG